MVLNKLRKTLSCVAWRFFREHYSFVGSTAERLAPKKRTNERQSPRGFSVLASPQTSFGFRSSRIHFCSAGRLPLRQTTQARKNLCWLFLSRGFFCVQTHRLPTVDFSLRGGGEGGVITQANPSRSLRGWWIPTWQTNCLSMNLL